MGEKKKYNEQKQEIMKEERYFK